MFALEQACGQFPEYLAHALVRGGNLRLPPRALERGLAGYLLPHMDTNSGAGNALVEKRRLQRYPELLLRNRPSSNPFFSMKSMIVGKPCPLFRFVNTNGRSPRIRFASVSITSSDAPT